MNIDRLLARLKTEASVVVEEARHLQDGTIVYILVSNLSFFPLAPRKVWYVLIRKPNQDRLEEEEILALLRRFWHAEIDISSWLDPPSPPN